MLGQFGVGGDHFQPHMLQMCPKIELFGEFISIQSLTFQCREGEWRRRLRGAHQFQAFLVGLVVPQLSSVYQLLLFCSWSIHAAWVDEVGSIPEKAPSEMVVATATYVRTSPLIKEQRGSISNVHVRFALFPHQYTCTYLQWSIISYLLYLISGT